MTVEDRSDDVPGRLIRLTREFEEFRNEIRGRFTGAAVPGGALRIQDASGAVVGLIGKQADGTYGIRFFDVAGHTLVSLGQLADASHGVEVQNVNGRDVFKVTSESGQIAPRASLATYPNGGAWLTGQTVSAFRPGTSSAVMFELWRADFYSVGSGVDYDFSIYANAGNMTWQILCYETGGTPTVVVGPTVETTNIRRFGTFTVPVGGLVAGTGTDPTGRNLTMRVQAQLNSGAVTADVAMNAPPINHN